MCGKMGNNEIDSMKNMMSMSVYFVIADSLDIDAMDIDPNSEIDNDLHMTSGMKKHLNESVVDMFDGKQLDFSTIHQVHDIVDQIVANELNTSIH